MVRASVCAGALALLLLAVHAAVASQRAVSPTMHAYVHPDESIGLTFDDGTQVGNQARTPPVIPPGTYTIRVIDDTPEHNFHLAGPGVDQQTDTGGSSSPTWVVTLQPGSKYHFQCDTHVDFMYGDFTTSGTSTATTTTQTSTSVDITSGHFVPTLDAVVSEAGKATLRRNGKAVTKVKAGRYRFFVTDNSKRRGFTIQRTGFKPTALTTAAYVGRSSKIVTLLAGRWSFSAVPGGAKGSFTVTP